ncbi:MAG TPA: cytochrome c [Parafilimonas sp.]|nr:cytochrome c [Parafilimonas sp.]
MRKFMKVLGISIATIIIAGTGFLIYVKAAMPNVGKAPDIKAVATPERIKHGEYLANHVTVCINCHSERDYSLWSGPVVAGSLGKGGEAFTQVMGFPGKFYARNISPTHLGNWTDGEIYRTITTGVDKNNKALFSIMPWDNYGRMDPEDIKDIIAYIRTLPPQSNEPPKSEPDFPMNFILNMLPHKATGGSRPPVTDQLAYGAYMLNAADCRVCHTKQEKGKITGEPFAGGFEFGFPGGSKAYSANITPDKEAGIGNWSEAAFINKFKQYADSNYQPVQLKPGDPQTVMPWTTYAGMDSTDIKAIYAYLKTIKPVNNKVEHWKPKQ